MKKHSTNWTKIQDSQDQQHNVILSNHNTNAAVAKNNHKNLKYASIQPNGEGKSNQILAALIHGIQQEIVAMENLRKLFNQMLKLI